MTNLTKSTCGSMDRASACRAKSSTKRRYQLEGFLSARIPLYSLLEGYGYVKSAFRSLSKIYLGSEKKEHIMQMKKRWKQNMEGIPSVSQQELHLRGTPYVFF